MRHYISHSDIAFNVQVYGKKRHIRFDALSQGGSRFSASDSEEIAAIESHSWFNNLFRLDSSDEDVEPAASEEPSQALSNEVDKCETLETHAEITSCAEAKTFLRELGAPTTVLRTKAGILTVAKEKGVFFPNL